MKPRLLCFYWRVGSTDMQHDLFWPGHDLDLRSPSKFDLSRSTLYHSTRLSEANTMVCESFLYRIRKKSYCRKTIFVQKCDILTLNDVRRLNGWPELKPKCILTKELDESCRMFFFRVFLAIIVSELRPHLSENVEIGQMWPLVTSGDLVFDLT